MGMPPVCSCLCEPADATGASSSSSGSLFSLTGCGCVIQARTWQATNAITNLPAFCTALNSFTLQWTGFNCRWESDCLAVFEAGDNAGQCCMEAFLLFGPGTVQLNYITLSNIRLTYEETFANLGISNGGSCLGTWTLTKTYDTLTSPNCCVGLFQTAPTTMTISPA